MWVGIDRRDVDVSAVERSFVSRQVFRVSQLCKHHVARFKSEQCVVLTHAYVLARVEFSTTLSDENVTSFDPLARCFLQSEELGL